MLNFDSYQSVRNISNARGRVLNFALVKSVVSGYATSRHYVLLSARRGRGRTGNQEGLQVDFPCYEAEYGVCGSHQ